MPLNSHTDLPSGAPVVEDVRPILGEGGDFLGLLTIRTSLIQLERHRHRHGSFRVAVEWLKAMCAQGELAGAAELSPFQEMDGILLADAQLRITYLSGIANNLYRRLGYMEDLRGRHLNYLHTGDDMLAITAMQTRRGVELESKFGEFEWVRKAMAIWPPATLKGRLSRFAAGRFGLGRSNGEIGAVLIMIHDATEERRKKAELEVKSTMIQEVHHRVKNNLQNVAAVLRMQQRRAHELETEAGADGSDLAYPERRRHPRVPLAGREPVDQYSGRLPADRDTDAAAPDSGPAGRVLHRGPGHLSAQRASHRDRSRHQRAGAKRPGTWLRATASKGRSGWS